MSWVASWASRATTRGPPRSGGARRRQAPSRSGTETRGSRDRREPSLHADRAFVMFADRGQREATRPVRANRRSSCRRPCAVSLEPDRRLVELANTSGAAGITAAPTLSASRAPVLDGRAARRPGWTVGAETAPGASRGAAQPTARAAERVWGAVLSGRSFGQRHQLCLTTRRWEYV